MPPVYQVYDRFKDTLTDSAIVRLLGGNRAEIEQIADKMWDRIVSPRADIDRVRAMLQDKKRILTGSKAVFRISPYCLKIK